MLIIDKLKAAPISVDHLEISPGIAALTATSGAGKSRLFRAIADLVENTGSIKLNTMDREKITAPEWRTAVRYVSAEPAWWEATAREHLPEGDAVTALANQFNLTPKLFDCPIEQLSSGERQRFGLVRALADNPPVLLLDEPTAALDEDTSELVEAELKKRAEAGCIIFLISHSKAQIARIADRVLTINNGHIEEAS